MSTIDDKDIKILRALAADSRLSLRKLSRKVGLSITSVINRVEKLESRGVIRKYTVELEPTKLGFLLPVIIDIRVSKGRLREVEEAIAKYPNVIAVYDITGDYDVSVIALFRDRFELDRFIKEVQRLKYVERTYTKMILNIIKEDKNSILEALNKDLTSEKTQL